MAAAGVFQSTTFKLVGLGFLTLLMLVPLGMVSGLRSERESRRSEAEDTIATSWGNRHPRHRPGASGSASSSSGHQESVERGLDLVVHASRATECEHHHCGQ